MGTFLFLRREREPIVVFGLGFRGGREAMAAMDDRRMEWHCDYGFAYFVVPQCDDTLFLHFCCFEEKKVKLF